MDVRIIAATHKDLQEQVQKNVFRQDLFYRLNVLNIHLPPLRTRSEDIPLLVEHFLKKYADQNNEKRKRLNTEAMERLAQYHWPGNVRELENALERAVVMSNNDEILAEHITISNRESHSFIEAGMTLNQVSGILLEQTLKACNGNKTKAAKMMGVSLRWIHYQLSNSGK